MSITEEILDKIDNSIRLGDYDTARRALSLFTTSSVPERLAVKASSLLVRAGMPKKSARILFHLMYDSRTPTKPVIAAQYALSLQQLGAYNEAFRILEGLNFNEVPVANLYYSHALFSKWEYEKAIPYLEKYLSFREVLPYQRLVATTNLAQSYISARRFEDADRVLTEVETEAKKNNYKLLLANCLELKAQLLHGQKNYKEAIDLLSKSQKMLEGFPSHYQIMVEYWKVICELASQPKKESLSQALKDLRNKAVERRFWPVVRECDYQRAVIEGDENLFLKVYFGTPFSSYRKKLRANFPRPVQIPKTYQWNPAPGEVPPGHILRVKEGLDVSSGEKLKKGQLLHRVLSTLTSDFYVPFRAETIFTYVFPNEHYNPLSSNKKTANAVSRLQHWLNDNRIPLKARLIDNAYRIYFISPYLVEVPLQEEDSQQFDNQSEIEKLLGEQPSLSSQEIADKLGIPKRTVNRRLNDLISQGRVVVENKRYRRVM